MVKFDIGVSLCNSTSDFEDFSNYSEIIRSTSVTVAVVAIGRVVPSSSCSIGFGFFNFETTSILIKLSAYIR